MGEKRKEKMVCEISSDTTGYLDLIHSKVIDRWKVSCDVVSRGGGELLRGCCTRGVVQHLTKSVYVYKLRGQA